MTMMTDDSVITVIGHIYQMGQCSSVAAFLDTQDTHFVLDDKKKHRKFWKYEIFLVSLPSIVRIRLSSTK